MSIPNKTLQGLLILPLSGRTQVIIRREFYVESIILNCKDVFTITIKHAKGEAMVSQCPLTLTDTSNPFLVTLYTLLFFFLFLFIKQEKVDRCMLVNANCLYSRRHTM